MNKEEIVERIKVCEKCESNYRKVNRLDRASAFSYEKIKWRRILSKLEKVDNYKQALIYIREYIHSEEFFMLMNSGSIIDCPPDKPNGEDYFKAQGKLDQIIDKVLGDEK